MAPVSKSALIQGVGKYTHVLLRDYLAVSGHHAVLVYGDA